MAVDRIIETTRLTLDTNGSGAGQADSSPIHGALYAIGLVLHADTVSAGSLDLTITEVGGQGRTLLTLANYTTSNALLPVRVPVVDPTGEALSSGDVPQPFAGTQIRVTAAQGGNNITGAVQAFLYILR